LHSRPYKKLEGRVGPRAPRVWPDVPLEVDIRPLAETELALVTQRWPFQHIRPIGYTQVHSTFAASDRRTVAHGLVKHFDGPLTASLLQPFTWAVVQPVFANVHTASMKFDVPQELSHMQHPSVVRALDVLDTVLEPLWTASPVPWHEVFSDIDFSTSSGLNFTSVGLQKKGDVLNFPDEFSHYLFDAILAKTTVLFKTVPKIEFLSLEEIDEKKIRIFNSPSVHFLMWQKHMYLRQNQQMKQHYWFKLGTNMRQGGAHRLTSELVCAPGEFVLELDMPRCDKNHRLMRWVYQTRHKYLTNLTAMDKRACEWISQNLDPVNFVLFDGLVCQSRTTNPSGQFNTGDDNNPWTASVVLTLAIEACPSCSVADLKSLVLHVYADDFRGKFPSKFSRLRDLVWFAERAKSIFNVEFKPGSVKIYDDPEGSHFLGADTVLRGDYYVAKYNAERLRAAWFLGEGALTAAEDLLRLRQLLVHSWPHADLHSQLRAVYVNLLTKLTSTFDAHLQAIVRLGVPSDSALVYAHLGLESRSDFHSFFHEAEFSFLHSLTEVGGVKNVLMNVSPSATQSKSKAAAEKDRAIYATLNGKAQDLLARGKALLGKAIDDGSSGGSKPTAEHAALAKRVGQLAATVKSSAKTVRQGGEGKSSSKGANGVSRLAPGGLKRPLGVGPNTSGVSNAIIPRNGLVPGSRYIHINGVPHLQMVHNGVYRNFKVVPFGQIKMPMRPSFGTKNMPTNVANGTMFFSGGPQFTEKVGKEGHVVRIADTQMVTSLAVDQAIPALGFRLPGFELSPEALGGYLAQFASMYEENALIEAEAVYAPCVGNDNEGALGMSFRNNIGQDGLDIGPDAYNEFVNSPAFAQAPIYEQMSIPIRPSKLAEAYFNSTGGEANDEATETQGEVSFMSGSALAAGQQLGNFFITYVWEFKVPALSSDLFPVGQTVIKMGVNNMSVANSQGTPVYASQLDGDVVPDDFPGWFLVSGPQLDFTNVYEAFISRYTAGEPLPPFYIPDRVLLNGEARFALGQSHYCKFINKNTDGDFTIDNYLYFFESKAAAMSPAFVWELDEGGQNPGQYLYVGSEEGGPEYGGPTCACYLILRPVASQI